MKIIICLLSIVLLGASHVVRAAEPAATQPPGTNAPPVVKEPPVTKEQVLAAIAVLETNAASEAGVDAAGVIIRFARESETVKVMFTPETFPWLRSDLLSQEEASRKILLGAYFGGNIRAQLNAQTTGDDIYEGWVLAISAYRQIQMKKPNIVVPEIDDLAAKQEKGELKLYAAEVRNKKPKPKP
jgi:hypothetical protein